MKLRELLNCEISGEQSREHNRRVVEQAATRSSTEAFLLRTYSAVLDSGDPYGHIPAVPQLRAFANNEFGQDLTPEAVRRIRGRVCEALDIDTAAADALPLARVLEVFRDLPADTPAGNDLASQFRWLRVSQVARLFAQNAPQVSRLADAGAYVTNGKRGPERRIDVLSVIRREFERLDREEGASGATGS